VRAKNIPEVGTLGGYLTIWLAEEVKQSKRGKFQLVFIDADKENN